MGLYAEPRLLPAGDLAVSVELADDISPEANARVLTLERLLLDRQLPGLVETLPTFRSLLVTYDPLRLGWETLAREIAQLAPRLVGAALPAGRWVELPVAYGGEFGFELDEAARRLGLDPGEVVRLHTGAEQRVYFIGFTPGLPYLAGMPERLAIARLERPRARTPAGSVAIGGRQCSIYSVEAPGGFWVLGRTPVPLYDPDREDPILLRPGDRVRFRPIDAAEFHAIAAAAAAGTYRPLVTGEGRSPT
jgi:KipI family sensor histidine kinase inhibitor